MGEADQTLTTNQKVVTWARGKLGKKIGRGECWDLGEEALKAAGAYTSNDLGPVKDDSDYVWGDHIELKDVQPGDILQIRNHVVLTTTNAEYQFANTTEEKESWFTAKRGHHTAIVDSQMDANGVLKTLEQHVKPKGDVVQNLQLYTRDVPATVIRTTEKRINPKTKKLELAKVTRTVTIKVTGTIWAYRPRPKQHLH